MLALFYWIIDVRGWSKWSFFFKVIGMNSITIYLGQRIIPFGSIRTFFLNGVVAHLPTDMGNIVNAAGYIAVCWLFLYFLYRKKTFLKI
jgi:predicted acyltransferase